MRHSISIILLLSLLAALVRGQSVPQLTQSVVAGGGGVSAQGSVRVEGTVGQGVVATSSGGAFSLYGGFDLTFHAINQPPTANGQSLTTDENTPLPITLTGTDDETPAASLVYTVTSQPAHGTLGGNAPNMTYTPANGYVGADGFKFTVTDTGDGTAPPLTSAEATISINVVRLPAVSARDARVAEPVSGQAQMLFTLTLDRAPTSSVSVDFNTSALTGAGAATSGSDYTTTNGTTTFQPGQRVQTVIVPVIHDDAVESDETFLLQLSNVLSGHINDGEATGSITSVNTAGAVLISELRAFGPGADSNSLDNPLQFGNHTNAPTTDAEVANTEETPSASAASDPLDEYVEVYNNSDTPITVAASDASAGWGLYQMGTDCNATPVLVGIIPNETEIPARGHFLLTGASYSLGSYAEGDALLSADIGTNSNVALFSTTDAAALSSVNRLDAVGFDANTSNNCALLRESTNLNPIDNPATLGQHSFVRKITTGISQDTNDNATDFWLLTASTPNAPEKFGAPGPENLASRTLSSITQISTSMVAPCRTSTQTPNRERLISSYNDTLSNTGNFPLGTLAIRRTFTNMTGADVKRLRYRLIDITAGPAPTGTADLRAITSPMLVSIMNPCGVMSVNGTTLDQPPSGALGGGLNSSMSSGTITLGTPLAHGSSIDVQFLFGVAQGGGFRFYIIFEALQ